MLYTVSLSKSCIYWGSCFLIPSYHYNPNFHKSLHLVSPCPHKNLSALRPKKWPFETEQSSPLSAEGRRHTEAFSSLRSVSFFVRGVIWHWAERYNCNIMSQILSFLTHLTSLPVGSISTSHSKISAIYW